MQENPVRNNLSLTIFTVLMVLSISVHAKDISSAQRDAYEARQTYIQQKADYESLLTRIAQQEEYVAQEQAKLDQLKTDEVAAKAKLDQSKSLLQAKVKTLNEAWDLRDQ